MIGASGRYRESPRITKRERARAGPRHESLGVCNSCGCSAIKRISERGRGETKQERKLGVMYGAEEGGRTQRIKCVQERDLRSRLGGLWTWTNLPLVRENDEE